MAYHSQNYPYPRGDERDNGYADLNGMRGGSFSNGYAQQPQQYYHQDRAQQPTYPSYAPYVSDEERVLALLSSSSSDNLRGLDGLNIMTKAQYPGAGNESLDWYGSPYMYSAEDGDDKRYLEQAREVDLDVYHHHRDAGRMGSNQGAGTENWRSWADLGHAHVQARSQRGSFGSQEDEYALGYKPAAAFQPFAEDEMVMEDEYEYGEDEYDGQNQLSRSQTLDTHGSYAPGREHLADAVRKDQEVGQTRLITGMSPLIHRGLNMTLMDNPLILFPELAAPQSYKYALPEFGAVGHSAPPASLSCSSTVSPYAALIASGRLGTLRIMNYPSQLVASVSQLMPLQQQQQYGDYYGNEHYSYPKASHPPRGGVANPFGAVGSEAMRFDPMSAQAEEQASDPYQAYSHLQPGAPIGYENAYGQDAHTQYPRQHSIDVEQMRQPQPLAEEPAPTSGVGLSGWLAEAVWQLCTVPFEPSGSPQQGRSNFAEYVKEADQLTNNLALTSLYPDYSAFGNHVDSAHFSPCSQNYSGFSSPDVVSFRELKDSMSDSVSPVMNSSSNRMTMNPYGLRTKPSQAFVEFVHRTLSQTLLSPTAVILSLWYIRRLAIHSGGDADGLMLRQMLHRSASDMNGRGGEEAAQRILTLGLACSNKWLDDNTFTNKSWSDVTLLPLAEINSLELYALGPLKFDLSISVHEWDEWLFNVNQGLTPFVTDGLAVASAINLMRQALGHGNAKFEADIVSRRSSSVPSEPVYRQHAMHEAVTLPPLDSVVDFRHLHGGVNAAVAEYGSSGLDYGSQSYGRMSMQQPIHQLHHQIQSRPSAYGYPQMPVHHQQQPQHHPGHPVLPSSAAPLPPSQMETSSARVSSQAQHRREGRENSAVTRPVFPTVASSSGSSCASNATSSYSGHQYYLSQLASQHQPRFMSVLA